MPIEGLSKVIRIPRLGKIKLGIKKINANGVEYPEKTAGCYQKPESKTNAQS